MSDIQHVLMLLDLLVEVVSFGELVKGYFSLSFEVLELPAETIVAAMEVIGGQQIGDCYSFVEILFGKA